MDTQTVVTILSRRNYIVTLWWNSTVFQNNRRYTTKRVFLVILNKIYNKHDKVYHVSGISGDHMTLVQVGAHQNRYLPKGFTLYPFLIMDWYIQPILLLYLHLSKPINGSFFKSVLLNSELEKREPIFDWTLNVISPTGDLSANNERNCFRTSLIRYRDKRPDKQLRWTRSEELLYPLVHCIFKICRKPRMCSHHHRNVRKCCQFFYWFCLCR